MRIWFVNRFYWPDEPATAQLLGDLAEGLASRGHEVHVLTSRPARPGPPPPSLRNGVFIHRIPTRLLPGDSLPVRALAFTAFLLLTPLFLCLLLRREDRLVALTDPPFLGLACRLAAALRGAVVFHWIQDIYPEVAMRILEAPAFDLPVRALVWLRNRSWRAAARCVAPSAGMALFVSKSTLPDRPALLLHNWAPAGLAPVPAAERAAWRQKLGLQDHFVLMYSGNLGRVHDMEAIPGLLARLHDCPSVILLVAGRGAGLDTLREACTRAGVLQRVHFLPACPREQLALSLACADLHLVTLLPGCENLVFPSKLYGIAAVASPVLAIAPAHSDLVRLVREHGMGLSGPAQDLDSLAAGVRSLVASPSRLATLGQASHKLLASTGDAAQAVLFWESLLATPTDAPPRCLP